MYKKNVINVSIHICIVCTWFFKLKCGYKIKWFWQNISSPFIGLKIYIGIVCVYACMYTYIQKSTYRRELITLNFYHQQWAIVLEKPRCAVFIFFFVCGLHRSNESCGQTISGLGRFMQWLEKEWWNCLFCFICALCPGAWIVNWISRGLNYGVRWNIYKLSPKMHW